MTVSSCSETFKDTPPIRRGCHAFAAPLRGQGSCNHHRESMLEPAGDRCFRRVGPSYNSVARDRRQHGTRNETPEVIPFQILRVAVLAATTTADPPPR